MEIDGQAVPLLHVSQLRSLLGLPGESAGDVVRLGWDAVTILEAWLEELRALPWAAIDAPTPSRGRSLRNLTVNVFHPFELLPAAWETHEFPWDPDLDGEREAALPEKEALVAFADAALFAWRLFLAEHGDAIGEVDPAVASPRGEISWSALLASQRWHAGFHLRQLEHTLALWGRPRAGAFSVDAIADLDLPAEVF